MGCGAAGGEAAGARAGRACARIFINYYYYRILFSTSFTDDATCFQVMTTRTQKIIAMKYTKRDVRVWRGLAGFIRSHLP